MPRGTTVQVSRTYKTVGIMTLITSLLWTGFSVYSAATKKADVEVPASLLEPISPTLDTKTLEALQTRRQVTSEVTSAETVQKALDILLIEPATDETATPQPTATPIPEEPAEPAIEEEPTVDEDAEAASETDVTDTDTPAASPLPESSL